MNVRISSSKNKEDKAMVKGVVVVAVIAIVIIAGVVIAKNRNK